MTSLVAIATITINSDHVVCAVAYCSTQAIHDRSHSQLTVN